MGKIWNYIVNSFKDDRKVYLSENQQKAIRNLMIISKERLWLSHPMLCEGMDTDNFDEEMFDDTAEKVKVSINIVEKFLEENEI